MSAWLRGKYNGQRIVGFRLIMALDITQWGLRRGSIENGSCTKIGPLRFWLSAEYEPNWRNKEPTT
jgi:hypothetical protein